MKYFFRIIIALILACATVLGVYYYTNNGQLPWTENSISLTTVSKAPATEKYANRALLATDKKEGYSLYLTDTNVILAHGKKEFEFKLFSSYMQKEKPEMHIIDLDSDGKKDVVVKCVSGEEQDTGEFVYDLYILHQLKNGAEAYEMISATQTTWHEILDYTIVEEISQLKHCKKFVQFAMTLKSKSIEYNEDTGIAEKNVGYVGFFRALQNSKGEYLTADNWSKGKGSYYVNKENKLCCEVEVLVKYKDSNVSQKAGTIYFELRMNDKSVLYISAKSMVFTPNEEYKTADPRTEAKKPWSRTFNNSASPTGGEALNWIKYTFTPEKKTLTSTLALASEESDIKYVNSVTVSEKNVVLTAKNGFTFDSSAAENGEFSLTINEGGETEAEISYTAAVSEDGKTLTINYDKTYPFADIENICISYGAK